MVLDIDTVYMVYEHVHRVSSRVNQGTGITLGAAGMCASCGYRPRGEGINLRKRRSARFITAPAYAGVIACGGCGCACAHTHALYTHSHLVHTLTPCAHTHTLCILTACAHTQPHGMCAE